MQAWENTDEEEREKRRQKSKEIWNSMSDLKKQNMIKAANIAVRSSKEGSLEKYTNRTFKCWIQSRLS